MPEAIRLDVKAVSALSEVERDALGALTTAVYPPDVVATSPGRAVKWATVQYSILVWTPDRELGSHVGLLVRDGRVDEAPVRMGGIGSVKTHPRLEGRGYASVALRRAAAILHDEHHVAFSLLVCRDELLSFYGRLGWKIFGGRLLVEQPTGRAEFTLNRPMVLAGQAPPPRDGTIDLCGLPW
jgi:hypothetical protein